jgi:hypothetical protein
MHRTHRKYLTQVSRTIPAVALAAAALLFTQLANAASIQGSARNQDTGAPLVKVPVCLAPLTTPTDCSKIRWTDKKGKYSFSGLQAGEGYAVIVNGDTSARNRKFEAYANYAWTKQKHTVAIRSKSDKIQANFTGKFNFSNFQRIINLTAADFPELDSLDLAGSYVALKVFILSLTDDQPPETIFLGQVSSLDTLKISASVPLASSSIQYEIFSAVLSLSGSIALTQ